VLVIRKSNYINTASGVVLSVSDCPMCRLRRKELYQDAQSAKQNSIRGKSSRIHSSSIWANVIAFNRALFCGYTN